MIKWLAGVAGAIIVGVVVYWLTVGGRSQPPAPPLHSQPPTPTACQLVLRSPDGRYQAVHIGSGDDIHFEVRELGPDRVLFRTRAQHKRPNDVKAGSFTPDSARFVAAYHYSHDGNYTWVGVWEVPSGSFIREEPHNMGWRTDLCAIVPELRRP